MQAEETRKLRPIIKTRSSSPACGMKTRPTVVFIQWTQGITQNRRHCMKCLSNTVLFLSIGGCEGYLSVMLSFTGVKLLMSAIRFGNIESTKWIWLLIYLFVATCLHDFSIIPLGATLVDECKLFTVPLCVCSILLSPWPVAHPPPQKTLLNSSENL